MMFEEVEFETMAKPEPSELLEFYARQHHATHASGEKIRRMLDHTACLVVARHKGEMIGFARGVSDGLSGWLVECKLDPSCQGPGCVTKTDGRIEHDTAGIAAEMARRVIASLRASGVERVVVMAYGTEVDFCEELGFRTRRGVVPMELPTEGETLDKPVGVSVGAAR